MVSFSEATNGCGMPNRPCSPLNQPCSVTTRVAAMMDTTSMTVAWKSRRCGRSAKEPMARASTAPAMAAPARGSGHGRCQPRM